MAKKPKHPLKNGTAEEASNSSSVFKTLFGDIPEQNPASNSIFSEDNPFRRKLVENRQSNKDSGLGLASDEAVPGDSSVAEIQLPKKRKKDELKKESSESIEGRSKKLRGNEKDSSSGFESEETLAKNFTGNGPDGDTKRKKKRKLDEVEAEYEVRRYGVTDEMKENKGDTVVLGEKRKKMDNPEDTMVSKEGFDDESKLLRTIFVGNLPLKLKKKEIAKEFAKFGEVESVRIRSVPIIDGKIPRKGAVIKKQINENGDSVHAYVVFKTEESAQASLANNMAVVGGYHIRVDRACPPRKKLKGDNSHLYDNKRTVFVGNLPFDVRDEEIYQLFCGMKNLENSVEAVRVVRDPGSSLGRGIAYVLFKTMDGANMVVKKHNLKIRDRELRVSHAKSSNSRPQRQSSKRSRDGDSGNKEKGKASLSYQGMHASKSGGQKKGHTKEVVKKFKSQPEREQKSRQNKRPSVAARKEKALQAATGTKRKRSPVTAGPAHKKKPRNF